MSARRSLDLDPTDHVVGRLVADMVRRDDERWQAIQAYVNEMVARTDAALTGLHGDLANLIVRWEAAQRVVQRDAPGVWAAIEAEVTAIIEDMRQRAEEAQADGAVDGDAAVSADPE